MIEQTSVEQFTVAFCSIVIGVSLVSIVVSVLFLRWMFRRLFSRLDDLYVDGDDYNFGMRILGVKKIEKQT